MNDFQHRVRTQQHVVIPKTQNSNALLCKPGITLSVVCTLLRVLPTIQLNAQFVLSAVKIEDVAGIVFARRMLPAELRVG